MWRLSGSLLGAHFGSLQLRSSMVWSFPLSPSPSPISERFPLVPQPRKHSAWDAGPGLPGWTNSPPLPTPGAAQVPRPLCSSELGIPVGSEGAITQGGGSPDTVLLQLPSCAPHLCALAHPLLVPCLVSMFSAHSISNGLGFSWLLVSCLAARPQIPLVLGAVGGSLSAS